ncbi:hypothetical protein Goshw_023341 [Gossypium schwendimanii]|uniref:Uncharacterized protein n=1 Tax=Gossypium schwendimanii TaxID=34291 RepID=A0A7J9KTW8_GOSSC|nr:hypothetical protein [Gossypium schwendimanii]
MVKVASIQNLVMSSLAILKMVGGMATSSVLPLMEQGDSLFTLLHDLYIHRCIEIWNEGVVMSRQQLDADAVL